MCKSCLKKTLGKASLTYDELSTVTTEIEAVLNSRPLTYVDSDDLEESFTPSLSSLDTEFCPCLTQLFLTRMTQTTMNQHKT